MALEIKFRPRHPVKGVRSREVAVFIALDGRQMQSAGTVMMTPEEIEALREAGSFGVMPQDGLVNPPVESTNDVLLWSREGD